MHFNLFERKPLLTNDNVQSWSNGVDHPPCGVAHTVCGTCIRSVKSEHVLFKPTDFLCTTRTCRDDANVKWTRLQRDSRIMLTNAGLLLRAPNHTMEDFTEHAIASHTHHTVNSKRSKITRTQELFFFLLHESTSHPARLYNAHFTTVFTPQSWHHSPVKTCQIFL